MFNVGDIIKTPFGRGFILYAKEKEHYILWVNFSALGLAKAPFRLEQVYEDEPSFSFYKKIGHSDLLGKLINEIKGNEV